MQCLSNTSARNAVSISNSNSLSTAWILIFSINAGKKREYNAIAWFNCSIEFEKLLSFSNSFALMISMSGSFLYKIQISNYHKMKDSKTVSYMLAKKLTYSWSSFSLTSFKWNIMIQAYKTFPLKKQKICKTKVD